MVSSAEELKFCIPGERLFKATDDYKAGSGTYVRHGHIYSSLAGCLYVTPVSADPPSQVSLVEVRRERLGRHAVPFAGAVITARVTAINLRFCKCSILCVESSVLSDVFSGQIRKEDVRLLDKDHVEMHKCFRPGDIILARVLTLGDAQSYLLTTAEEALGVVSAFCENGHQMKPVSFSEVECTEDSIKEPRKLAKVPYVSSSKLFINGTHS